MEVTTNKPKAKIETHPLILERKISKCSNVKC